MGSKLRHKSQFGYAAMEKEAETEGDIDDVNAVDGELNLTRMTTLRTMETDPSTRENQVKGYLCAGPIRSPFLPRLIARTGNMRKIVMNPFPIVYTQLSRIMKTVIRIRKWPPMLPPEWFEKVLRQITIAYIQIVNWGIAG